MNDEAGRLARSDNNTTTGDLSRPGGRVTMPQSTTSLQGALVNFQTAVDQARGCLTPEEFGAYAAILASWVAREHRRLLERDELQRSRAA